MSDTAERTTGNRDIGHWILLVPGLSIIAIIALAIAAGYQPELHVRAVKRMTPEGSDITYGRAFNSYLRKTEWEEFESDGEVFVNVSGQMEWAGRTQTLMVQYRVRYSVFEDHDDPTVDLNGATIGDIGLAHIDVMLILADIFGL